MTKLTLKEIHMLFDEINELDLMKVEFETLVQMFKRLTEGKALNTIRIDEGIELYRIRKHDDYNLFKNISELWYPKSEIINSYGRVNKPGGQIFYSSVSALGVMRELKPKIGQYVSIVTMELKEYLSLEHIGVFENINNYEIPVLKKMLKKLYSKKYINSKEIKKRERIMNFLVKQFTLNVPENENYKYKISAAIADNFLSLDRCHGIVYPSIALNLKDINIALKPQQADQKLKVSNIDVVEISRFDEEIEFLNLFSLDRLLDDGTIKYTDPRDYMSWGNIV